ncbi:hypothetical protein OROHE_012353 [Orobanche hederae]
MVESSQAAAAKPASPATKAEQMRMCMRDLMPNSKGLKRQPKWGHLKDLHRAIKRCEPPLVSGNPTSPPLENITRITAPSVKITMNPVTGRMKWKSYTEEPSSSYDHHSFTKAGLLDHLNTTRDNTDYLWYMTDLKIGSKEGF